MRFLVTGAAGFIGAAISQKLLENNHEVVGIDNLNDYYNPSLKNDRLNQITDKNFTFIKGDIADKAFVDKLFAEYAFEKVIHLAAQAGVRYSLENPYAYIESNILGHLNLLEACRHFSIAHFVYASSSSVYGLNNKVPFKTTDSVDHPVSLYAATKKSDELMSHAYSHLYGIPTTGLRFFTVYGPWGRPDMAPMKFGKKILSGESIDIYNHGNMSRDFTYITDIVEGIYRIQDVIPKPDKDWMVETGEKSKSSAPYQIYNIGNGEPVSLMDFITILEKHLGKEAKKNFLPMQAGDVYKTWADTEDLFKATNYQPQTNLEKGVEAFAKWYIEYYPKY